MKPTALLSIILLLTIQCFAQENTEKITIEAKVKKYKNMKQGGAALTIVGGILVVVGVATMASSLDILASEQNDTYKSGETVCAIGMIALAPGIPLLIIGAHNQRKYSRTLDSLSVRLNVNTHGRGLTLSYRF